MPRPQASLHDAARGAIDAQAQLDGAQLDDALLDRVLDGHRLAASDAFGIPKDAPTLRGLSARGPLLLVFLRHYG